MTATDIIPTKHKDDDLLRADDGMTLLEVLVVIVIIGLIATLGTVQVMAYLGRSKVDVARLKIKELTSAVDLFQIDAGRVPDPGDGLRSLVTRPANLERWQGPYVRDSASLIDPWGRPYVYRAPGQSREYAVVSLGRDGKPGGEGEDKDISSEDGH